MELIFDTFIYFVARSFLSDEFLLFDGFEVSDLDVRITVDSLGPGPVPDIEIESDEIEYKRKESHLSMPEESHNDTNTSHDNRREESYFRSDIGFERLENRVPDTASDHHDRQLSDRKIQKDLIFIFDLYGDLILHIFGSKW